jgi:hypothetical protein
VRTGLPQGLSVSPILATAVMACLPFLEGLVMYADDGLIMRWDDESDEEINKWFEELRVLGVEMDPKKSGPVGKQFKFLGVEFDLEEEKVSYKKSMYSWKGKDITKYDTAQEIYTWFKLVGQRYGKESKEWTWEINPDSMITRFGFNLMGRRRIGTGKSYIRDIRDLFTKLWESRTYKGYRWFIGRGIYHISSSSTKSCIELMKIQKDLRLVKVKSFKWEEKATDEIYRNKGKYEERRSGISVSWNSFWLARRRYLTSFKDNITEEERKTYTYAPSI